MKSQAATVASLLDDATTQIAAMLGLENREARLEARVLGAFAWNVNSAWLIAHNTDPLSDVQTMQFQGLLTRRLASEPVAYILGTREFYGRPFHVSPDVLIPRPDTELLVGLALERIPSDQSMDVLDLGTGSGCIAITLALERPLARITAVDRSAEALVIARRNADILDAHVEFLNSDWFAGLAGRRFDLIVGNPPYVASSDIHLHHGDVRHEPPCALTAGAAGLDDLRHIVEKAPAYLRPKACLLLEHGYNQAESLHQMLEVTGFRRILTASDLAGILRVSGGSVSE